MADAYAELFRELYQKKYTQAKHPRNCIERVKQIQRKMKQTASLKKISRSLHIYQARDGLCSAEQLANQNYAKIIRFPLQQPKKILNANVFHGLKHEVHWWKAEEPLRGVETANCSRVSSSNRTNQNPVVQSHRYNRPPMQLLVKSSRGKSSNSHQKQPRKISSKILSRKQSKNQQRQLSRNVVIAGQNLQQETDEYRRKCQKMDKKISLFDRQSQQKNPRELKFIGNCRKTINTKQDLTGRENISFREGSDRSVEKEVSHREKYNSGRAKEDSGRVKEDSGRVKEHCGRGKGSYLDLNRQREDNIELLPWSLIPQHELY